MNTRVLIFGLIAIVIVFALAMWFASATYDETATTTGGGTTIEDTAVDAPATDEALDALPTPAPVVTPEPDATPEPAPVPEPAAPAAPETTAPEATPAPETTEAPAAQ